MAKARAIVKRRKAVRNIRKITKTMQMIATARFQKSLRRAVGTKPYTRSVRELVAELTANVGDVCHPLLRRPGEGANGEAQTSSNRIALIVITSNRGLAGAYNGSVLRTANQFIHQQDSEGRALDLYVSGRKGAAYFNYQRRPIAQRFEQFADMPRYAEVRRVADDFIQQFTSGRIDALYVAYMNFISTGQQKPDVLMVLPLGGVGDSADRAARPLASNQPAAAEAPGRAPRQTAAPLSAAPAPLHPHGQTMYDFSPSASELLDELLPLTVRTALFQCFMDAVTSEHVARMIAMKSATDSADKMARALTMQYNRARQSQITTELSEIMGGVEAMKS